jgi:hypothetical protein
MLYRDVTTFRMPPGASLESYRFEIGWWQPASSRRLDASIISPRSSLSVPGPGVLLLAPTA